MQTLQASRILSGSRRAAPQTRQVSAAAQAPAVAETYEVSLPKPIGVRFGRGNDGGCYVSATDENAGYTDERIQPGDKVVACSASFGDDIWPAEGFGQVMYALKTRNGDVYLKLEAREGDLSCFEAREMTEAEKQWQAERAGGNYGAGTKEIQERNYVAMKEMERKRKEMFEDALVDFREGSIDKALVQFEEVKGLEPEKYIGDSFERVSRIYIVTLYNIACCYAALKATDAGLEALEECMRCGFDEFGKIRKDPNLAYLREDERFTTMMNKFDEPILNENAIKAIKSLFSFGKN